MSDDDQTASPPPKSGPAKRDAKSDIPASGPDIALIGGPTENGVQILRMREGQVELGELRAQPEGKPILGESVRLHAREDHPGVFDVETIARGPLAKRPQQAAPALPASRKGPAKVSSEAYRTGWDSIFKTSGKPGGDLPN
jgi:hypothetical protein